MKRYRTITLGCKVNQCESTALGHLLEHAGYCKAQGKEHTDLVVINTCTVTGRAAMQSRQAIRKAVAAYPAARVVATGCHAQIAPEQIRLIRGVDLVVGHSGKMHIAELLTRAEDGNASPHLAPMTIADHCSFAPLLSVARNDRTRAFLKIQDGCDTWCTYCIVPRARGRSRSMPVADVVAHMRRLGADGFREVVLTGIHLGHYGRDLSPPFDLTGLLEQLTQAADVDRIRLSSIEPTEVDDRLMDLFERHGDFLCRHFHIPLQSGDNSVLRRMRRPYTREAYARLVRTIRKRMPRAAIGTDVMAGFPGETDAAFADTCALLETLPITYLHVFPFSAREGTAAATFKNRVPESAIKERCRHLRRIGTTKRNAFLRTMIGQDLPVLIQSEGDARACPSTGLSDNYLPVTLPGRSLQANTLQTVRIVSVSNDGTLVGTPILSTQ